MPFKDKLALSRPDLQQVLRRCFPHKESILEEVVLTEVFFYLDEYWTVLIQIVVVARVVDFIELRQVDFVLHLVKELLRRVKLHFVQLVPLACLFDLFKPVLLVLRLGGRRFKLKVASVALTNVRFTFTNILVSTCLLGDKIGSFKLEFRLSSWLLRLSRGPAFFLIRTVCSVGLRILVVVGVLDSYFFNFFAH